MNPFHKSFHTSASDIRLTHAERRHIHLRVTTAIRETEMVASPYMRPSYFTRALAGAFVLVLIVGVSGGTAFAAENTLPGDLLYPVKVSVTEPVEVALATTPEGKANANARIAARRLSEAAALASEGRLNAATSADLAANFNTHAVAMYAAADTLRASEPDTASEISANFSNLIAERDTAILSASASAQNASSLQASSNLVVSVSAGASDEGNDTEPVATMAPALSASNVSDRAHKAHQAVSDLKKTLATSSLTEASALAARSHAAALANLVVKADAEASLGSTTEANKDYATAFTNATAIATALRSGTSLKGTKLPSATTTAPLINFP